jgi:uncharacterized protein YjdB
MRRHARSGATVLVALSLAVNGCGEKAPTAPIIGNGASSSEVSLTKRADTVAVDDAVQLKAIVPVAPGTVAPSVSWSSSDPSVAIVTQNGVLFALKSGRTTVTANSGGHTDATSVTVLPSIREVAFETDSLAISVSQSVKLPYRVTDSDGNRVDISTHKVEWATSDAQVVPLTGDATVTGRAIGSADLLLRVDNKEAVTKVKVMAKPVSKIAVSPTSLAIGVTQTATLSVTSYDMQGNVVTGRETAFSSSDQTIAYVSSSGVVTGVANGQATITVTVGGRRSTTVPVTVGPAPANSNISVASVTVSLGKSSVTEGQSTQATATTKDANGNVLTGRTIVWHISDPAVASVDGAGAIDALDAGAATVSATSEGITGSAPLTVTASTTAVTPVASMTLTVSPTLNVGQTAQAVVTLKDASGNVLTGRTVNWVSSEAGIVSVSTSGLVTALRAGGVTISASVDGVSASAVVSAVAPAPSVRSITLSAGTTQLKIGQLTQVTAVARDANGDYINVPVTFSSNPSTVATVSPGGVAAGVSVGSATIFAKADTVTRSMALSVIDSASTTPPPAIPPPSGTSYGSANAAVLPKLSVNTGYPTMARQVRVPAGTSLQAAINAAQPGDELLLAPGASYVGNFSLPPKSGSSWIVIRTDLPDATIGLPGTRMTPSRASAANLAKIQTPNYMAVLTTDLTAHHYRFTGVEIGATSAAANVNGLVRFGDPGSAQSSLALTANNLIIDRSYVHGTTTLNLRRCVMMNSATTAVIDSWLSDCHDANSDSQAIVGWNGPGPYLIQNNHLESGHEVIVFGGSTTTILNQSPSDVTIRGNHISRPAAWKGVWTVKNLIETKHVRRMLVEGNVIESNWADAQAGFAFVLKSENQNNDTPWTQSTDITIRYNRIRNTGNVFNLAANPSGAPAISAGRMVITDNVIENVNTTPYIGDGHTLQLLGGLYDIVFMHNTVLSANGGSATTVVLGSLPVVQRLTIHSNVLHHGAYGIKGGGTAEGSASLSAFAPGYLMSNNVMSNGGTANGYPGSNWFPGAQSGIGFVNLAGGDYHIASSSPYASKGYDGRDVGADIDKVNTLTQKAVVAP